MIAADGTRAKTADVFWAAMNVEIARAKRDGLPGPATMAAWERIIDACRRGGIPVLLERAILERMRWLKTSRALNLTEEQAMYAWDDWCAGQDQRIGMAQSYRPPTIFTRGRRLDPEDAP